jgi:hypothetical protein
VTQRLTIKNDTPPGAGDGHTTGYTTAWNESGWMIYLPDGATGVTLATPRGWEQVRTWSDGMGRTFLRTVGWLGPGASATLRLTYSLPAGTFAGGVYRLTADPQPILVQPSLTVSVGRAGGDGVPTVVLDRAILDRTLTLEVRPR